MRRDLFSFADEFACWSLGLFAGPFVPGLCNCLFLSLCVQCVFPSAIWLVGDRNCRSVCVVALLVVQLFDCSIVNKFK